MLELGKTLWESGRQSWHSGGASFSILPSITGTGVIGQAQVLNIGQAGPGGVTARLLANGAVLIAAVTDGQAWVPDASLDGVVVTLESQSLDSGTIRSATLQVVQAAPVASGALADMTLNADTGTYQQDCSVVFSGASLTYSLDLSLTGLDIDAATGLLVVDTALSGLVNAVQITVRASNSGGLATHSLVLTVANAQSQPAAIDHVPTLSLRNALADVHLTPIADGLADGENSFTGFADTSGFTIVDAPDANTALAAVSSNGVNGQVLIRCNWNGSSNYGGGLVVGPKPANMVANASVDWGYVRPNWSVKLVAGSGFSPTITYAGGSFIDFVGLHWFEVDGLTFDGAGHRHRNTATYPGIAVAAYRNCIFSNTAPGTWAIEADLSRTLHVENCHFEGNEAGINGSTNYFRSWANTFRQHGDNDIHAMRNYNAGYASGWTAHAWVAGATVFDQNLTNTGSSLHPDFFQVSHPNDNHQGYAPLIEFNVVHSNRHPLSYPSQAMFGDDGSGYDGTWCVHNNIMAVMAFWGCVAWDPNDNQNKYVYRNLFARAANGQDQDSFQRIRGLRSVAGSGSLDVRENYYAQHAADIGLVNGEVFTDNVALDFRNSEAAAKQPENLLTGNGSWTTNAYGWKSYTSPDAGLTDPVAARAAITAFLKPQAGWRGVNCGPLDPASWPAAGVAQL
jgi:hypothetical protein